MGPNIIIMLGVYLSDLRLRLGPAAKKWAETAHYASITPCATPSARKKVKLPAGRHVARKAGKYWRQPRKLRFARSGRDVGTHLGSELSKFVISPDLLN